ncbi:hypothetical protein ACROYT_G009372 [Oculina patagonica]
MAGVLFVGAFLTIFANAGFVRGFSIQDNPVSCEPRQVVLALDPPNHQYVPYFIDDVYRCSGGCNVSPKTYRCVAKTQNNITGDVVDLANSKMKRISVVNHTSCECTCVTKAEDCSENEDFDEGTCSCQCKYTDEPPTPCPNRFSWNPFPCKCECARPPEFCTVSKEWSHQACGCVCTQFAVERCRSEEKYLNATTCECEDPIVRNVGPGVTGKRTVEEVNWKRLVAVMIGELIVLVVLFDLYLYWRHKAGVFHWMHDNCCCPPKDTTTTSQAGTSNAKAGTTNGSQNHSPSLQIDKRADNRV